MTRRWAALPLIVALTATACRSPAELGEQRNEVLARTCVSFAERRYGQGFDRIALAADAGPDAFGDELADPAGNPPAGVAAMVRLCRPLRTTDGS